MAEGNSGKGIGCGMAIVAGLIIFWNVAFIPWRNNEIFEREGLIAGLVKHKGYYTFTPPLSGFEILVYIVLVVGIITFLISLAKEHN